MTTGDVVYSLRFSLIKILPESGFDLRSTAGESCVLTARLHILMLMEKSDLIAKNNSEKQYGYFLITIVSIKPFVKVDIDIDKFDCSTYVVFT